MSRTNRMSEIFSKMTGAGVIRAVTGGGDTTVKAGGVVAGAVTCPVTALGALFTDLDPLLIGNEEKMEVNEIQGAPADPMPLKYAVHRAHDALEPFKEGVRTVLGDLTEEGVSTGFSGDFNAIRAATKRLVMAYLHGHLEGLIEFKLLNWNLENVASAMGVSDVPHATLGPITGAATSVDPSRLVLDGSNITVGPVIVQAFYFTGALKGGVVAEIQAWGAEVDPTALSMIFKTGAPAEVPFKIRPVGGISFETY